MKHMKIFVLGAGLLLASGVGTLAEPVFTKGVVKKVKPEDGKVTIVHEELVELDMPAMTMVFRVAEEDMFDKLEPGSEIEFVAERVDGKLTVTQLKSE